MSLAELLAAWGYWAVLAGAFLEGETLLLLGGYAASRGYLSLPLVIGVAALGGFFGDQFYFALGRRYGERLLARFPRARRRAARVRALLERYHSPIIVAIRFLYGLRIAGPVALGMTAVPWGRFFVLNLIGAILWASAVTLLGYIAGAALAEMLGDLKRYEALLVVLLAAAGLGFWTWRRRRESLRG